MLVDVIRITLAVELLLIWGEGVLPALARYLPLGGSHLAQLGACLAFGVIVADVFGAARHLFG